MLTWTALPETSNASEVRANSWVVVKNTSSSVVMVEDERGEEWSVWKERKFLSIGR